MLACLSHPLRFLVAKGVNTIAVKMKRVSETISFKLIFTVHAAVFTKYSVINGTKGNGTGSTIPCINKDFVCCIACENDVNCTAVNNNEDDKACELLYGQPNELFTITATVGWKSYFKSLKDVDLLSNAVASQSSNYDRFSIASRAIDGVTNRYDCTHTADTGIRWLMLDFQSKVFMSSVILWNRLNNWVCLRNLRVTVGDSLQALNNNYNLCGHYTGPPSSKHVNSVRIDCTRVMYGRYLKIEKRQPYNEALALCEVKVIQ